MFKFLFFIFFFFSLELFAQSSWNAKFESYFFLQTNHPQKNSFNPGNRLLEVPTETLAADLRPDLEFNEPGKNRRLVLRPRLILQSDHVRLDNPEENKQISKGRWDLTDFFFSQQLENETSATVGLQVYQWGPAELINASNPFFHFHTQQKSAFYKEKGRVLIRVNKDWSSQHNQVLLFEPINNQERTWQSGSEFSSKLALKSDYSFADPRNYLGLILGLGERSRFFVGEYTNYYVTDSFSLYLDARHSLGSSHFVPARNDAGFDEMISVDNHSHIYSLALVGLRFEQDRYDLRYEFLANSAGLNGNEMQQAWRSIVLGHPLMAQNADRLAASGLEFLGRNYSYLSLRVPDLGGKKDVTLFVRLLKSHQDDSHSLQLTATKSFSDHWDGYLEFVRNSETPETEFAFLPRWQALVGARWAL